MHRLLETQTGVTLTELMVVLGIIAVTAAIAVPNFYNWQSSSRIKSASRDVSTSLLLTRSSAVETSLEHRVIFDPDASSFQVEKGDRFSASTTWVVITANQELPSGVTFLEFDVNFPEEIGKKVAVFSPEGGRIKGTNAGTLTIDLINKEGQQYQITIVPRTGHVQIRKQAGS